MKKDLKVGVFGATGYTGIELLKILKHHAFVDVVFVSSEQNAGQKMEEICPQVPSDLVLQHADSCSEKLDVVFLCLPHQMAIPRAIKLVAAGTRVIDLSADFRLSDAEQYPKWYGFKHGEVGLLQEAVYGLNEFNRVAISKARLVANPGCYPTAILLGLLPLAQKNLLDPARTLMIDAKSGVSGAGRKPELTSLFAEVSENLSPYKVGNVHRHVPEIAAQFEAFAKRSLRFIFTPHLVPMTRGMLVTMYVPIFDVRACRQALEANYADAPFVEVLADGKTATVAHVARTNRCAISLHPCGDTLVMVSAIDNLLKGASGQAVQNLNTMFDIPADAGLQRSIH